MAAITTTSIAITSYSSTYGVGVSNSYGSCPTGGSGVGKNNDRGGARYTVTIATAGSYVMDVQFGSSTWSDKSYGRWDAEASSSTYDLYAGESQNNALVSSTARTLTAGTHYFYLGSATDGNYYTLPWCSLTLRSLGGALASSPPPPPVAAVAATTTTSIAITR